MATIYLIEQGAKLLKESSQLLVEKDDKILLEIPIFKVERIFIFGNIQITTQAMKFLLDSGIETSFFSISGKLIGKLIPIESKNVYLRINQYEKHKDEDFKLLIARTIVDGKIKNMKTLIQKYARNHPEIDFSGSISCLDNCLNELQRKTQVSTILGIEGRASAIYFESFGRMVKNQFLFEGRVKRPPTDPVNSLLSLGYSLITSEMFSVLSGIGFDVYLGFLHSLEYGRPSLALDLVEEFRQPLIDRLTLEIINKEVLKIEDFEEKEQGIYLKEEALKTYFRQYERKIQTEFQNLETGERTNYRKMFLYQAQKFAKTLTQNLPYTPFQFR